MNERRFLNLLAKAPYKLSVYQILRERAIIESADYAEQYLQDAMMFDRTLDLWNYAANSAELDGGLVLEFGVFRGNSINHFSKRFPEDELHGFDSFEGLAEDWTGYHLPKGTFDLGGNLPKVNDNVNLYKGWFDKTLPLFLKKHKGDIRLCHIDCDTYDSALFVLQSIAKRLVAGSIVVFDEYYGYPNWKHGEFKAWQKTCDEHDIQYKYIAFSNMQVAVQIL